MYQARKNLNNEEILVILHKINCCVQSLYIKQACGNKKQNSTQ